MTDCEDFCQLIRAASTEGEVIAAVRHYLTTLDASEIELIPQGLTALGVSHADEVVHAALEIARREALAAYDAPEMGFLKDAVKVFSTAAMRLAALSVKAE